MARERFFSKGTALLALALGSTLILPAAWADSCTMQSQMPAPQRDQLSQFVKSIASDVQTGNLQAMRAATLPAVASNFGGIANSATQLKPDVQQADITVDDLFTFTATPAAQGSYGSQFFCSPPDSNLTVVLNFSTLPPGNYGLAILHATGVPKPQQISLILAATPTNQWQLAGFFAKPLMLAGQNGVWYWTHARDYAKAHDAWAAWFYYQIANYLVQPADFVSSPNLDKLRQEAQQAQPHNLPGTQPVTISANGNTFQVTRVDTSSDLGPLDFVIHYTPDPSEAAQLRDPVSARKQVVALMSGILAQHPGLRTAFHGLWVYADQGNTTAFALELPMNQIPGGSGPTSSGE